MKGDWVRAKINQWKKQNTDFKLLFGGENFEISVKHMEPETLRRIPIFVSTNKNLDYWIAPPDGEAINARTKTFYLKNEIQGWSDRPQH